MSTHTTHSSHQEGAHHGAESTREDIPIINVERLLERFRLPGIDVPALMDAQKKNIKALQEANQKVYDGALALATRQTEILEETIRQWQDTAKKLTSKGVIEDVASKQADFAQKAVEKALGNMRELAEMAVKSQAEAYEVIGKRVQASIGELRDYINK